MTTYNTRGDLTTVNADRSGILDHEVLAAARFCAAAGGSTTGTRFLLDVLGLQPRATELASPYVGSSGWLGRRIRELKPVGYLELKTQRRR